MKFYHHFTLLLLFIFLGINQGIGQKSNVGIYPQVQQLTLKGEAYDFNGFRLEKPNDWSSIVLRTAVGKMLTTSSDGIALQLSLKADVAAWKYPNNLAKADGAYDLTINANQAKITARDSTGIFYGLQTLRQLVKNGKIAPVEIHDYPTVKYRGVVEGFYGTPWSQNDRIRQIQFYGSIKANTYIYGPKDDPYHSSPNWRKPYPEPQAENIKKLVGIANANFVDFVWAIHPGQDIKWTNKDRKNVLKKFEDMYDLGVRSFALFFDDISGEGTNAHKQAGLLNYLNKHLVKAKKDVKPLMLTPTDYNKSWAGPGPNDYLAILGRELDPSIQIMWTGDNVMADVTKSTLAWVQERIKRPALIWWNFPVSDYARNELFLGPSYGLEKGITALEMSGILSNPMEHAEASKPAIFGVADYGWNTTDYDAEESWKECLRLLLPNSHKAYQLFSENNSNPNKNLTSYAGKESKDIAPYLERIEKGVKDGNVNETDMIFTEGYFFNIKEAPEKVLTADDDALLLSEVKPWLENFAGLGQAGLDQLENYKYHALNPEKYWDQIVTRLQKTDYWEPHSFYSGDSTKIIPITGTRALRPFVSFLQKWNAQKLIEKITGKKARELNEPVLGSIHTNIDNNALKKSKVVVENGSEVYIQPDWNSFKFEKDKYYSVELFHPLNGATINLNFVSGGKDFKIETSADGKEWTQPMQNSGEGKITAESNGTLKFVRIINASPVDTSFRLVKLTIQKKDSPGTKPFTTHDMNLLTSYSLSPGSSLTERSLLVSNPQKAILLTGPGQSELQIEVNAKDSWQKLPQTYKGKYIEVSLPAGTAMLRVSANQVIKIYEVLWK